uniref:Uncharacterized protein n=1 Tax=Helicotheca tamesis TaxID=374047 RepID=A0A7S2E4S3_9STRA|mmetsp:Transcript_1199/g.1703  ORF Transcript_1199/g.1703 Transcript_1199/m.1703 type:complete len:318 (+) Transcript_1199:60-1013(+)
MALFSDAPSLSLKKLVALEFFVILSLFWTKTTVHGLSLNSFESVLFGSRMEKIQRESRVKFSTDILRPADISASSKGRPWDVTIIFPGAGGPDDLTAELEANLRSSAVTSGDDGVSPLVTTFDWSDNRGSVFTAAFDGEAVGEAVAESLLESLEGGSSSEGSDECVELRSVHSIGVSVGAFAANEMAQTIYQRTRLLSSKNGPPHVRLTLLDPFCSRGVWGNGYGATNFGHNVDYAVHYLNTDDPVPTTNDPLPLCVCVDVTGAKERDDFELPEGETMHCWPLAYYSRFGLNEEKKWKVFPQHDKDGSLQRGTVIRK